MHGVVPRKKASVNAKVSFRSIIGSKPKVEWGVDERIERSPGKLIFFLTIDDSHALNGPVVTQAQLVNRCI